MMQVFMFQDYVKLFDTFPKETEGVQGQDGSLYHVYEVARDRVVLENADLAYRFFEPAPKNLGRKGEAGEKKDCHLLDSVKRRIQSLEDDLRSTKQRVTVNEGKVRILETQDFFLPQPEHVPEGYFPCSPKSIWIFLGALLGLVGLIIGAVYFLVPLGG